MLSMLWVSRERRPDYDATYPDKEHEAKVRPGVDPYHLRSADRCIVFERSIGGNRAVGTNQNEAPNRYVHGDNGARTNNTSVSDPERVPVGFDAGVDYSRTLTAKQPYALRHPLPSGSVLLGQDYARTGKAFNRLGNRKNGDAFEPAPVVSSVVSESNDARIVGPNGRSVDATHDPRHLASQSASAVNDVHGSKVMLSSTRSKTQ